MKSVFAISTMILKSLHS